MRAATAELAAEGADLDATGGEGHPMNPQHRGTGRMKRSPWRSGNGSSAAGALLRRGCDYTGPQAVRARVRYCGGPGAGAWSLAALIRVWGCGESQGWG